MFKFIINTKYFNNFRKKFLLEILYNIKSNNCKFCCHVKTWRKFIICWKNIKEVKDNMDSKYLIKDLPNYNCRYHWFFNKDHRILFLEECINKF